MLSRREMLTGGMFGSLASTPTEAAEAQSDRDGLREVAKEVASAGSRISRVLESPSLNYGPVPQLRKVIELFLRANQKFPDFCEIGTGVFFDIYDWHVSNRQQITVTRQTDNRYWIQFMFTTLVLRPETETNFIGIPYDKA